MSTDLEKRVALAMTCATCGEPMALLRWDFELCGVRVMGSNEHARVSHAKKLAETLCDDFGEGTHWVEPLNYSAEERRAATGLEGITR